MSHAPTDPPPVAVMLGECLGRYTVLALIGGGGMGEVYAATDPDLGRTVALKIIRPDRLAHLTARMRFMREARALARLHHPNVVTVYDVGSDRDRLFVAMEHIEGPTVDTWLQSGPHGWREILAVYLAAGRGLGAAHAAGIVHRDFKPQNVVVGKDRVVVIDFGLARAGDEDGDDLPRPAGEVLETEITMTGQQIGTPRYMAPEQAAGGRASSQSDQFSFCVSLWEALHGAHPGRDPVSRNRDLPARINDAMRRGLSIDPSRRWPSMIALLAELGRDRRSERRLALLAAGAAALAAVAAWGVLRPSAPDPCLGGISRIAAAWGEAQRQAVRNAFVATGSPIADDTLARTGAALDAYASRWAGMYGEICRATRLEGRQSDSMMDLRMACLERRRSVLASLTQLWTHELDRDGVAHAVDAVRNLESLAACADARALADRAPQPSDAGQAVRVKATHEHLDAVQAMIAAHRLAEARVPASEARAEADKVGWTPLSAEAAFVEGDTLDQLGDPSAEAPLIESARLATVARDDRLVAKALVTLVGNLGRTQQNAARALLIAEVADGSVTRVLDDALRARLLRHRAEALAAQGKYEAARATLQAARAFAIQAFGARDRETLAAVGALGELARQMGDYRQARALGDENLAATVARLGPEHPQVVEALTFLGAAAQDDNDREAAADYFRRALAISERIAGPDSTSVALILKSLGNTERTLSHYAEAEALLDRSLAIRERVLGPEHPDVAATLVVLGEVRALQGRFDEAIALQQRALAIVTKVYGAEHAKVAIALHKLGFTYTKKGDLTTGLHYRQRSLDVRMKVLGPDHEMTLFSMSRVGISLTLLHRCAEARPILEAAAAGLKKRVGEEHSDLIQVFTNLAMCDLDEGHAAQAVARLEHALPLEEKPNHSAVDRRDDRFLLARALWAVGRRGEAVASARKAEDEVVSDRDADAKRTEIRAWLKAHRVGADHGVE